MEICLLHFKARKTSLWLDIKLLDYPIKFVKIYFFEKVILKYSILMCYPYIKMKFVKT